MAYIACEYCGAAVEQRPGKLHLIPIGGGWWGPERFEVDNRGGVRIAEVACERCVQRSLFLTLRKLPDRKLTFEPTPHGIVAARKCIEARVLRGYQNTPAGQPRSLLKHFLTEGRWREVLDESDTVALSEDGRATASGWVPDPGIARPIVFAHDGTDDPVATWADGRTVVFEGKELELTEKAREAIRQRHFTDDTAADHRHTEDA